MRMLLCNNVSEINNFVIDNTELANKTGLFFIGVGCALAEPDNKTKTVEYRAGNSTPKYFEHQLPISYTLQILAKGCFYVDTEADSFRSHGLKIRNAVMPIGDKIIGCSSTHLTTFSIGITGIIVPNTFDYIYKENAHPATSMAIIIAVFSLFCGFAALLGYNHDKLDICKGRIRFMEDNHYNTYFYMIAVQTGYRMFATTDSNVNFKIVFINLIGTSGSTLARKLKSKSKMGEQFRWGTTERFVMATEKSLGELKSLRVWIDESGLAHRQSWFCNKMVFKDLQTGKIYEFAVNNWFGMQNGDGKTERLVEVRAPEAFGFIADVLNLHSVAEHLSYWNMFTVSYSTLPSDPTSSGGLLTRWRFTRLERVSNVYLALSLALMVNLLVTRGEEHNTIQTCFFSLFRYCFTIKDASYTVTVNTNSDVTATVEVMEKIYFQIWLSLILSLICVPSTIIVPWIHSFVINLSSMYLFSSKIPAIHKAEERGQDYRPWSKRNRDGKFTLKHRLTRFVKAAEALLGILCAFITLHSSFYYFYEEVLAFSRRTIVTLVFWILLIEPLKMLSFSLAINFRAKINRDIQAIICAAVVTRYFKDYALIRSYEMKAINCIKEYVTIKRNKTPSHPLVKVTDHGQRLPYLHKSYEIRERRMREEQLFLTGREIIGFFSSITICLGLAAYSRDVSAYYYKMQVTGFLITVQCHELKRSGSNNDDDQMLLYFYIFFPEHKHKTQYKLCKLFNIENTTSGIGSFLIIKNESDFWSYMKNDFIESYQVSWYNGEAAKGMTGFLNDKAMSYTYADFKSNRAQTKCNYIQSIYTVKVSRLMGYGILRQIRSVPNRNCKVSSLFAKHFDACEGYTQKRYEDNMQAYDRSWKQQPNYKPYEYVYRSETELQGSRSDMAGEFDKYSAAGYIIPLNGSKVSLRLKIQQMQDEHWIDRNTRGLFIEFAVYNGQTNHFAVISLSVEVPPFGTYYSRASVEVVRLIKYIGPDGTTVITFEALYLLFCVVYLIKELYKLFTGGALSIVNLFRQYFKSFGKISDVAIVISSFCSLLIYWMRAIAVNKVSQKFLATNGNAYIRLNFECDLEIKFLGLMATIHNWLFAFRFNRRIGVFASTLARSLKAIAIFAIIFIIVNFAFDSSLYLLLVSHLESYRNPVVVAKNGVISLLGKLSSADVITASGVGSVIYLIFMLIGIVGLLNIFVMMIMYEFEEVRFDPKNQTNDYEVVNHIETKILRLTNRFKRHHIPNLGFPDKMHTTFICDRLLAKVDLLKHSTICLSEFLRSYNSNKMININD
uniref:PLAT domain-containing protein n=1 Tax=Syphacia muris TaxID=451379 RepID=A0A0N5AZ61_9BILA